MLYTHGCQQVSKLLWHSMQPWPPVCHSKCVPHCQRSSAYQLFRHDGYHVNPQQLGSPIRIVCGQPVGFRSTT
jgi:hypothetical protein